MSTTCASKPTGQVKFLNVTNLKTLMATLPIKPVPVSALPANHQKMTTLEDGLTTGPPNQDQYNGHFDFTLEDTDGFVLAKLSGAF